MIRPWAGAATGFPLWAIIALAAACGGVNGFAGVDNQEGEIPEDSTTNSGQIEITVNTLGGPPGITYTITISNGHKYTVPGPNATILYNPSRRGVHEIAIEPIPPGCTLTGSNPVVVTVGRQKVTAGFEITCAGQA